MQTDTELFIERLFNAYEDEMAAEMRAQYEKFSQEPLETEWDDVVSDAMYAIMETINKTLPYIRRMLPSGWYAEVRAIIKAEFTWLYKSDYERQIERAEWDANDPRQAEVAEEYEDWAMRRCGAEV